MSVQRRVGGLLRPGRLEAFSDGVFAVAITLLVINLRVPESIAGPGDFLGDLARQWPEYVSLLISFATVGIIWINHHAIFTLVERVDRTLMVLNLVLLLAVVIMPFPTEMMGRALQTGSHRTAAVVLYSLSSMFMGMAFGGVFLHATRSPQLRHRDLPEDYLRHIAPRFMFGTLVYALAIVVAFPAPYVALGMNGVMAIYYAMIHIELGEDFDTPTAT